MLEENSEFSLSWKVTVQSSCLPNLLDHETHFPHLLQILCPSAATAQSTAGLSDSEMTQSPSDVLQAVSLRSFSTFLQYLNTSQSSFIQIWVIHN